LKETIKKSMQPKQYQIIDVWDIIIGMKSLPFRPTLPNAPLAVATKQAVVFNDMGSFFTWRQPSIKKNLIKQNKTKYLMFEASLHYYKQAQ
jgi:hypothetical protein